MIELSNLLTISAAFFVAAASPGPATMAVAAVSMNGGRKRGIKFGIGLSVGLAFWGVIAATGLGAVLQASGNALTVLKFLGGAYLLWLALNAARSATSSSEAHVDLVERKHDLLSGLLLNLLNPKAVFAWMAVLALGLGEASSSVHVATATLICMFLGLGIYVAYALVFSTEGAVVVYNKARRWIEGAVAGLFAVAGFGLIRSALVRD